MYKTVIITILCIICSSLSAQYLQWTYKDQSPSGDAQFGAQAIVTGADGNIYSAGAVNFGIPRNEDFTVESLDSLGNRRWRYLYQGPGGNAEYANDICYGDDGNIYACGTSHFGVPNYWDFCTISLNTDSTLRWVNNINGPGGVSGSENPDDEAYSICYGGDGNIYVCGRISAILPVGNVCDAFVVSYTSSGVERWRYTYNGPANDADYLFKVIYGGDGNIYAVGRTGYTGPEADFLVISLTSSGAQRWVFTYNGPGDDWDNGHDIFWGGDGNVYAIGTIWTTNVEDIAVISFMPDGTERWLYHYDGPVNYRDIGIAGMWGNDGNVYVCGYSRNTSYDDAVLVSVTPTGVQRWVYLYNDPTTNFREWFTCLTKSPGTDIYLAGYGYHGGTQWQYGDILVASVTYYGSERWVYRYNGPIPNPGEDYASAIAYGNGTIYVGGRSATASSGFGRSYFVMALKDTLLGIQELTSTTKKTTGLRVSPNPFINATSVFGNKGKDILIFDITGKQIAKERSSKIGLNLTPGVYFLQSEDDVHNLVKVIKTK
jgi:hypothetical protein